MPRIIYIFRKPSFFFSIENIFKRISEKIGKDHTLQTENIILPFEGFNLPTLVKNGRFVRKYSADLFHITGDAHYISLFLPSHKTVLTIHDCVFMYQSRGLKKWILKKLLLDWPVARSRQITTISENTKRDIMMFTGCDGKKISVIPNPVDDEIRFRPRSFNPAKPIILFIGTTPNKNLLRAIEALSGIPCVLFIIGKIPSDARIKLNANEIEFREFLNLSNSQMAEKYTESDFVLFPSTFEGFGMPIIEAQQAGRPTISSELSPMKDVAGDGACLVDPYQIESIRNGILKIINEQAYRQSLVENGFENVRKYDLDSIASCYNKIYQEILKDNECAALQP